MVKIDKAEEIAKEVEKTKTYGPMFGLLHPQVMDTKSSSVAAPQPLAAMQLELCGGVHGLADLARGLQVLRRHPGFEAESLKPLRYGTV